MNHASVLEAPDTSRPAASQPKQRKKRGKAVPIMLQVIAMIGIGALVYPAAANWVATLSHNAERSGYVRTVGGMTDEQRESALAAARAYNESLPGGQLVDPYSATGEEVTEAADDAAYRAYQDVLAASGTNVIGEVIYPRLGIGLPVYHGTSNEAITNGAGHLYGSSLPVGGPSTHSVLTSHSGLVHAKLFTKLPKAKIGDTFEVRVLGETEYYRVDDIETVEPFVTDSLSVVEGEDRVTLFTCTPIGVNSHRLLVHGVRIPAPDGAGDTELSGDGITAGFPWWAAIFVAASGTVAYALFAPPRRGNAINKTDSDEKRKP